VKEGSLFSTESTRPFQSLGIGAVDPTYDTQAIRATKKSGTSEADIRRHINGLYVDVRNRLEGADPELGTALGLGRMLADTCLLPAAQDWTTYEKQFDTHRLQNAYDWELRP